MQHLDYWPRQIPQEQKRTYCPECGALTASEVRQYDNAPDSCRLVCSTDASHWASNWGEKTWEGRIINR